VLRAPELDAGLPGGGLTREELFSCRPEQPQQLKTYFG